MTGIAKIRVSVGNQMENGDTRSNTRVNPVK